MVFWTLLIRHDVEYVLALVAADQHLQPASLRSEAPGAPPPPWRDPRYPELRKEEMPLLIYHKVLVVEEHVEVLEGQRPVPRGVALRCVPRFWTLRLELRRTPSTFHRHCRNVGFFPSRALRRCFRFSGVSRQPAPAVSFGPRNLRLVDANFVSGLVLLMGSRVVVDEAVG